MAKGRENFLKAFLSLKDSIGRNKNIDAGRCWVSLKKYLESCDTLSTKSSPIVIKMTLAGYDSESIGKRLGVTSRTIDAYKYDISVELYQFLGNDFFELFDDFKANRSEIILRIQNLKSIGVSPSKLIDMGLYILPGIEKANIDGLTLESCDTELSYLYRHCFARVEAEKETLSVEKMAYVLKVISGEAGTAAERSKVLGMLTPLNKEYMGGGESDGSFWQSAGL